MHSTCLIHTRVFSRSTLDGGVSRQPRMRLQCLVHASLDEVDVAGTFDSAMRPMANPDDELDLPDLDGESDEPTEAHEHEELDVADTDEGDDAFDDAAAGDAVDHGIPIGEGVAEGGLLADSDDAAALDVGGFDLSIGDESEDLRDDSAEGRGDDPDLDTGEESEGVDGGEEGPSDADEELKEEDLPALDADEDGDVADDELFERSMLAENDELRWDDRAWSKVDVATNDDDREAPDESGTLATPGDEPQHKARDAAWKLLEETGRTMAATFLPGGSVVVALATPDWGRALLVRILDDGAARIIAEIDPREETEESCKVTHLRWDAPGNRLIAYGSFGVCAFRPG